MRRSEAMVLHLGIWSEMWKTISVGSLSIIVAGDLDGEGIAER